jgi:cholest-4-en-3-one 26-monooxygenase
LRQIDLLDGRLYSGELGDTHEAYAWMRDNQPAYFDAGNGVWGLATYDAVREASLDRARFSSAGGIRPDSGALPMMIDMDDPHHVKRRKLVSKGFTPRRVQDQAAYLRRLCDSLIDQVCERGECDFVRDLAAPLPMAVIGDMLGVPPSERDTLLRWSDDMVSAQGGNVSEEAMTRAMEAASAYHDHAEEVIGKRKAQPADDLMSILVHAEVDGDRLADEEIIYESLLILVGGDETTRHVLSGGMLALVQHPDQRRELAGDPARISVAVEEMLRWVSPIKNMCRTVTVDHVFHGASLRAGQKVMLLYEAANFDDRQFDDPEHFDSARQPNPHLAFGIGSHFCLGNSLARLELNVMFERLLTRLPDIELAAPDPAALPRRPANFISGLEHLPVRFTPARPLEGG